MRALLLLSFVVVLGCQAEAPYVKDRRCEILGRIQSVEAMSSGAEAAKPEASIRVIKVLAGDVADLHVGGELDDDRVNPMLLELRNAGYKFTGRLNDAEWYELMETASRFDHAALSFEQVDVKVTNEELARYINLIKKGIGY